MAAHFTVMYVKGVRDRLMATVSIEFLDTYTLPGYAIVEAWWVDPDEPIAATFVVADCGNKGAMVPVGTLCNLARQRLLMPLSDDLLGPSKYIIALDRLCTLPGVRVIDWPSEEGPQA